MKTHAGTFALSVLLVAIAGPALAQPSFDCSNVRSESTEALICGDPELSALDREMDRLYSKVREQTSAEDFRIIRAYQIGWVKGRNESWKVDNPREFVLEEYRERISVLKVQAGEVEVPPPVSYKCTGGKFQDLTAVFYDIDPPVGVFTRVPGGEWPQYIANGWDDNGAIHYNTGGLDFVDRSGSANLNWAGTLMQCTRTGAN